MIKFLILLLVGVSLYGSMVSNAKKLFDEDKKYKDAIEIFQNFPNDGEAQYYICKAYLFGMGVDKNVSKAFEYASQSANQNNPSGLNLLGVLYQYGNGIDKDEVQALKYYKQAANLGNYKAMLNIGTSYYKSDVIKVDLKLAKEWFLKAVENGYINGYLNIGDMYYENYKDKDALYWYLQFESKVNFKTNKAFKERVASLCRTNYDDKNAMRLYMSLAKNGHYEYTFNLLEYIKKYPKHNNKDYMLFLLEKAANKKYNYTKSLALTQKLIYGYYYYTNQIKKAINFAENLYNKENNIKFGCELAFYYHNNEEYNLDLKKAYDISTKIINENKKNNEILACYTVLVNMYKRGYYLAKDVNQALDIQKKMFNIRDKRLAHFDSEDIAEMYMEDLKDYENARKWYKITYDLTQDKKYLTVVDEYIKQQPIYKIDKKQEQAIYPIIENFTNKDQVTITLETDKYYFIALMDKYINIYDKKNLELLKTLRGWIGTGINGTTFQMTYDENKKFLYCAGMNSTTDFSQNDIIKVFDIKSGKVVKTIDNKNAMKSIYLNISIDGKYLVSINQGNFLNIIDTDTNEIQHYDFSNIASFTKANIIKKDDEYLVNVLGKDNILYTFSINKKRQIKKELFNSQTSFKQFNGVHAQNILKNPDNKILNITSQP